MVQKCRQCHQIFQDSASFCMNCGSPRPVKEEDTTVSFCSSCGTKVEREAAFCAYCGARVQLTGIPLPHPPLRKSVRPRWLILAGLLVLIILTGALLASGVFASAQMKARASAADKVFQKGAVVDQLINGTRQSTIGSAGRTGWAMNLAPGSFAAGADVTMQVLTYDDVSSFTVSGGELVGAPVEIQARSDGSAVVYLEKPVMISMQIPARASFAKEDMDRYVAAVFSDGAWITVNPLASDLAQGIVTFQTDHLSTYAVIRLQEKAQIEKLASDYAKREWSKGNSKEQVMTRLKSTIQDALDNVGIKDRAQQDALILGIRQSSKYDALVADIESGKTVDLNKVCSEMTSDAIMAQYVDFPGSSMIPVVGVSSSLSKGTTELERGNYKNAAGHFVKALAKAFPPTNTLNSALESVNLTGILAKDWDRFSESIAYRVFSSQIGNKGEAYSITSPEWERVMTELYGSKEKARAVALAEYSKQSGKPVSELSKDTAQVKDIFDKYANGLKDRFAKRYVLERDLEKRQSDYVKIIQGMMKEGLLERGSLAFGSEMDIRDRVDQLFAGRAYILSLFGGKMPVSAIGETQEGNLNLALSYLLTFRGDTAEFFKWLIEQGYKPAEGLPEQTKKVTPTPRPGTTTTTQVETASTESEPAQTDPVDLDPDSDTVPVASSGNFVCKTWIDTRMDSFVVNGGTLTGASWNYSRGFRGYMLTGTGLAGETVSLSISATMGKMGYQMEHQGNDLLMNLKVYDASGKEIESLTQKIEVLKSGSASLSDMVSIQVPADTTKVVLSGSFSCNWVTPNAVAKETVAVTVTLKIN